ncbi:hypothetical protein [Demequina subtropica]|uniref:hypothetical protein n=1 Tax=Demequina subtropica TaxID=1638989 RepID=UPI000781D2ED|nr:hypothetical protein [Demequina subtropica]
MDVERGRATGPSAPAMRSRWTSYTSAQVGSGSATTMLRFSTPPTSSISVTSGRRRGRGVGRIVRGYPAAG